MDRAGELLSAVDACYRGAVDPELWTQGLNKVNALFDGVLSVVEIRRVDRPEVTIESSSFDLGPKIHESYDTHYGLICPRAAPLRDLHNGGVMYDDLVGDEATLDRDEYYTDFLAPQGLRYFLACKVEALANVDVVISVQRSRDAGRASAEDIARFARLAPHLAGAYALRLAFGHTLAKAEGFGQVADLLDVAFVLIGADGRPLHVSRAAESILATSGPVLSLTAAGLEAVIDGGNRIWRAVGHGPEASAYAGGTLDLPEVGLRLRIAPLHEDARIPPLATARSVVIIERTAGGGAFAFLKPRFGLTDREVEIVADLCAGSSPGEIAAARTLKLSTVRTHIARAREKAAARSILDLVRLALRGGRE